MIAKNLILLKSELTYSKRILLNLIRISSYFLSILVSSILYISIVCNKLNNYIKSFFRFVRSFIRICINKYLLARKKSGTVFDQTRNAEALVELNVKKLKNVTLIGGSSVYQYEGKFFYPEPVDVKFDRFAEEYRGTFEYCKNFGGVKISSCKCNSLIPEADITVNLMSGVAGNYAHWISEILPRLFVASKLDGTSINIIINEGLHRNLTKSIEFLLEKFEIANLIQLENGLALKVGNISMIEGVGYCQFEPRTSISFGRKLTLNSKLIRKMAREINRKITPNNSKKIYIDRISLSRGIINRSEVEKTLKKLEFTIIKPEEMTFEEQVSAFQGATHIVGATGAALANCVFCEDNAKILILTSDNNSHLYEYWPSMLGEDRMCIKYSKQLDYDKNVGIGASFSVDCNQLLQDLKSMDMQAN